MNITEWIVANWVSLVTIVFTPLLAYLFTYREKRERLNQLTKENEKLEQEKRLVEQETIKLEKEKQLIEQETVDRMLNFYRDYIKDLEEKILDLTNKISELENIRKENNKWRSNFHKMKEAFYYIADAVVHDHPDEVRKAREMIGEMEE